MKNHRSIPKKILIFLYQFFKNFFYQINKKPNLHLPGESARVIKISGCKIYVRPSFSDQARIREFRQNIYLGNTQKLLQIQKIKPELLLDFGANIGTSSLSITQQIDSVNHVIGVEADKFNYEVLAKNYRLWQDQYKINFNPIHGIVAGSVSQMEQIDNLAAGYSASGTFRYSPKLARANSKKDKISVRNSIRPIDLLEKDHMGKLFICKVDIEGGEEYLFSENDEWLKNCVLLSIEIHDRFNVETNRSSRPLLQRLHDYDFSIAPGVDILYCYNRRFIS